MEKETRVEKINGLVRGEIQQLRPYEPEPAWPDIRLDANESPNDVPAELKQSMLAGLHDVMWNRYPDPEAVRLRERLAALEQVPPEWILVGNGSDEIIRDLLTVYGGTGTRTVFPAPTFTMYRLLTLSTGGTPVGVPLRADWSLDVPTLAAELNHAQSRLLFLASPNNPTGNAFARGDVEALLESTERLVVIDEAYRMFNGNVSLRDLIARYPHAVILNTFSKSMSLAGLRLGYMVAHPAIIQMVNRVRLPYNVDAIAQYIGAQALEHMDVWRAQALAVEQERGRLMNLLQALPDMQVFSSQANFCLVQHPWAAKLKQGLAERGIAVRGFGTVERLETCLRITVGTTQENNRLVEACRAIFNV